MTPSFDKNWFSPLKSEIFLSEIWTLIFFFGGGGVMEVVALSLAFLLVIALFAMANEKNIIFPYVRVHSFLLSNPQYLALQNKKKTIS